MAYELWHKSWVLQHVDCGKWVMELYKAYSMYGLWHMLYGEQCVDCAIWSKAYEMAVF